MLNDLIQQPVCHGVEICKRIGLQGNGKEKHSSQRSTNCLKALSKKNVPVCVINLLLSLSSTHVPGSFQTWGSPAWIPAVLTQWKSSPAGGLRCFLEAKRKLSTQFLAQLLWRVPINHLRDTWNMFQRISIHRLHSVKWYFNFVGHTLGDYITFTMLIRQ